MVCIWIELTQVFTESVLVLKTQRKGPEVPFVFLLNSSITMSLWIVEKTYPVKLAPNLFPFSSLNQSSSSFFKDCKFTCLECSIMCIILLFQCKKATEYYIFSVWICRSISYSATNGTNKTSLKLILRKIKLMPQYLLHYP